ncbi:hypothetical protein A3I18_02735 [Candidatus Campbellbacteria bacterium RIFCSPLOWO2_02_FULL_35_11]|uniref:Kazal-like domain-containing protein n=2 Tax=Candidatus Campbelliibacteriota TaxID=1752727 RepID=A0A1F5ELK6_9BACT|nr:MAG: hypothetical protein A3E89_02640 [Candidatus Campbellbacteria bacterium RIFCSPHIGHO2_12_FULL_35_10]OGD70397.1 MAG: hypothetical protein A3I18_02735 [Candidatus Campbellbacteria bacterium RIFCSPLOWO2_02_FULL_35_11]
MNKTNIIILIILLLGAGFYFFKVKYDEPVVTNFEECMTAGNAVMESYPRRCADGKGNVFVEEIAEPVDSSGQATTTDKDKILCTDDQRKAEVCIELYEPVCATVNIQCIKAPCNPIQETFSNSCQACINPLVESYTQGGCK